LQDSGEFKQALEAFDQALKIRREIGDLIGVVVTLNNLATVAQDQREDEQALRMFEEALAVAKEIGDRNKIALVLTNLGEVQRVMGNSARRSSTSSKRRGFARSSMIGWGWPRRFGRWA